MNYADRIADLEAELADARHINSVLLEALDSSAHRNDFAKAALTGLLASRAGPQGRQIEEWAFFAAWSFQVADAMVAASKRGPTHD
jgi:hypothetical protein